MKDMYSNAIDKRDHRIGGNLSAMAAQDAGKLKVGFHQATVVCD